MLGDIEKAHDGECAQACNPVCPMIHMPVCGSNGQTYGNECALNYDNCVDGTNIEIAYEGDC